MGGGAKIFTYTYRCKLVSNQPKCHACRSSVCHGPARELISRAHIQRAATHVSINSHSHSRSRSQHSTPKHTSVPSLEGDRNPALPVRRELSPRPPLPLHPHLLVLLELLRSLELRHRNAAPEPCLRTRAHGTVSLQHEGGVMYAE